MNEKELLSELKTERNRDKMNGHFRTTTKGSWDNIKWNKNDVGVFSKPFTDRHGFKSQYIRFKGEKTTKVIPVSVFRKYFASTSLKDIDPTKWSNQSGRPKHFTDKKETQKEEVSPMSDNTEPKNELNEDIEFFTVLTEEKSVRYSIGAHRKNGKTMYELRKYMSVGGDSNLKKYFVVTRNADRAVIEKRKASLIGKNKKKG